MDGDCPANLPRCDPDGSCVECIATDDCPADWVCFVGNVCIHACTTDAECVDVVGATHCDRDGHCRECVASSDCPADQHCAAHVCTANICVPGSTFCEGDEIRKCDSDGDSHHLLEACEVTCQEVDDGPICVGGSGSGSSGAHDTDGASTGSAETSDASGPGGTTSAESTDDGCGCNQRPTSGGWWIFGLVALRRRRAIRPK